MYRIEIPIKLKTHNELKRMWCHPKRNIGRALYRNYKKRLLDQLPQATTDKAPKMVRVTITYYTKRLQDFDNFYACLKPLLDSMVSINLIEDDSPKRIELHATQVKDLNLAYLVEIDLEVIND